MNLSYYSVKQWPLTLLLLNIPNQVKQKFRQFTKQLKKLDPVWANYLSYGFIQGNYFCLAMAFLGPDDRVISRFHCTTHNPYSEIKC